MVLILLDSNRSGIKLGALHVEQPPTSERPEHLKRSGLWPTLAGGLTVLILLSAYLILRLMSSPIGTAILVVSMLLTILTIVGYLGAKRGHVAPFIAVALILPYLLGGTAIYASAQRVESELSGLFSSSQTDTSDESTLDENPDTDLPESEQGGPNDFVDESGDGLDDRSFEGVNCNNSLPYPGYVEECLANGGIDSSVGSGVVQGDPGFVDKNKDLIDDNYYVGVACGAQEGNDLPQIEGGQQEFAECSANGGVGGLESQEGGDAPTDLGGGDANGDGVDDSFFVDTSCADGFPGRGAQYRACLDNGGN
jgi:hypothetical protein